MDAWLGRRQRKERLMAKYVTRDAEGKVDGIRGAAFQPFDPSREVLADDDPELVEFRNRPQPEPAPGLSDILADLLVEKGHVTRAEIEARKNTPRI
jgi:hypothetical protein